MNKMQLKELTDFAKAEHKRLSKHYKLENNPKTRYTIFTKLIEEVGELSEALLKSDGYQRKDKLDDSKIKLEEEFADTIFTALILAEELNVDIEKAMKEKMKKIKERKY